MSVFLKLCPVCVVKGGGKEAVWRVGLTCRLVVLLCRRVRIHTMAASGAQQRAGPATPEVTYTHTAAL
jgi:hypothetical protein